MTPPFEFVNAIMYGKNKPELEAASEKDYNPFLTNRAFSYYPDTIFFAAELNLLSILDKKLQYNFYINTIRPQKRKYAKWAKKKDDENIEAVMSYYNYSHSKAKTALSILSIDQLNKIKEVLKVIENDRGFI